MSKYSNADYFVSYVHVKKEKRSEKKDCKICYLLK